LMFMFFQMLLYTNIDLKLWSKLHDQISE